MHFSYGCVIIDLGDVMFSEINLNLLKYFYEVVSVKNITKASQNLLISQPALSRAIKELEQELGTKLLERGKFGVYPTLEGELLYQHLDTIFKDFGSFLNTLDTVKNSGGNLYIGSTTTNFLPYIEKSLNYFRNIYPNIKIHITLESIPVLEEQARLGKLDILIKNDYEYMEFFEKKFSFEIEDVFVASKKTFPELSEKVFSLSELLNYPFVLLSSITHRRRNFDNYLRSQNIKFKPDYEFNSYSLCTELIKEGFGIGIGNPIHYQADDFIIISTDFKIPSRSFDVGYISTSKNKFIKEFFEILENNS